MSEVREENWATIFTLAFSISYDITDYRASVRLHMYERTRVKKTNNNLLSS